jgi:hypothetical protein
MNCMDRDEALLLLAQGQCDWQTHLSTRLHLLRCADCRARYQRFSVASIMLRAGTRSNSGDIKTAGSAALTASGMALWLRIGVGVSLILALATLYLAWHAARHSSVPTTSHSKPCRPDLKSDHCT